ncbi:MAG: hypothetical protein JKY37_27450 [Nannocystaceae bacterium]|nr:hypothetical protein [Nannocystaceae bacterium]
MGSKLRVFNAPTTTTRAAIRLIVSSTALVGGGSCGRPADVPLPTDSTNSTHRSSVQLSPSVTIVSPTPPAGRPDGWHVAESDLGRFSVELPLPSQSYRIENGPAGLPTRFEDTVVAYSNNKDLVYTFSCVAQGDGSALDKGETATLAKDFQRAFVPSGSVKSLPCRSPWTQCFEVIGEDRHLRAWGTTSRSCSGSIASFEGRQLPPLTTRLRAFESFQLAGARPTASTGGRTSEVSP